MVSKRHASFGLVLRLNCYVNVKRQSPVRLRAFPTNFSFLKRLSLEKPWGAASAGQERKICPTARSPRFGNGKKQTC